MNLACLQKQKKQQPSPFSRMRAGAVGLRMFHRPRERSALRCWAKSRILKVCKLTKTKPMPIYVSMLRGINVGGHKQVKMDKLRSSLKALGLEQVKTYIQSG